MHKGKAMVGFVYILSNHARTTFYIGVTRNLHHRMEQYRTGYGSEFCRKYQLIDLVYFEICPTLADSIRREKQLKNWRRQWKIDLIRTVNPELKDLTGEIMNQRL